LVETTKSFKFVSSARLEGRLVRFILDMVKEVREGNFPIISSCMGRPLILRPDKERDSSEVKPKISDGNDEREGLLPKDKYLMDSKFPNSVGRDVSELKERSRKVRALLRSCDGRRPENLFCRRMPRLKDTRLAEGNVPVILFASISSTCRRDSIPIEEDRVPFIPLKLRSRKDSDVSVKRELGKEGPKEHRSRSRCSRDEGNDSSLPDIPSNL
jgi:hypothetical protein